MDGDMINVVVLDGTEEWYITWAFKNDPEATLLHLAHCVGDKPTFVLEIKVPKKWKIYSLKYDDESTKQRNFAAEKFLLGPMELYGPVLITQVDASDNVQTISPQNVEALMGRVLKREKFCKESSLALGDGGD